MNTTSSLAAIALVGTIAATITGLAMNSLEGMDEKTPEIENDNMYKLDDQLVVELINRGEPVNTSKLELLYDYHGITYNHTTLRDEIRREKNCLPENSTWEKGQRVECSTGIQFPPADNELQLTLLYKDEKAWSTICKPSTSGAVGC